MSADDLGINPRGADRAARALEDLADRALAMIGFLGSSGHGWLDGVEHDGGDARFSRLPGRLYPARPQPPIVTP
jgi:hypothetical protein